MLRLHQGLLSAGLGSAMMCDLAQVPPEMHDVAAVPRWRVPEAALRRITEGVGLNDVHRISSWTVTSREAFKRADIVHIHGTHGGFLSYLALPAISRRKPVVFTLHDMWAMTGHCAYSNGCERWEAGCGSCPDLSAYPAVRRDATRVEWQLKRRVYRRSTLDVVAVSRWMADIAQRSILASLPTHLIHNGVDTDVFVPSEPHLARQRFALPMDRKVVLFCATNVDDPRKGWPVLYRSLRALPADVRETTAVLVVGAGAEMVPMDVGMPVVRTGPIAAAADMARAYVAADVFVAPSLQENLANTVLEALACGTPVIGSNVGGVPDMVRPGETGMLFPAGDPDALRVSLLRLLSDDRERHRLSQQCRHVAVNEFSQDICVRRYIRLYRAVVRRKQHASAGVDSPVEAAGTSATSERVRAWRHSD